MVTTIMHEEQHHLCCYFSNSIFITLYRYIYIYLEILNCEIAAKMMLFYINHGCGHFAISLICSHNIPNCMKEVT